MAHCRFVLKILSCQRCSEAKVFRRSQRECFYRPYWTNGWSHGHLQPLGLDQKLDGPFQFCVPILLTVLPSTKTHLKMYKTEKSMPDDLQFTGWRSKGTLGNVLTLNFPLAQFCCFFLQGACCGLHCPALSLAAQLCSFSNPKLPNSVSHPLLFPTKNKAHWNWRQIYLLLL